ncbi:hypothetical protein DPMN_011961 [Dreissena polymorpha]|uniref:Uncharacterized protein n=1 Tax=Dreissena polymorpha TaxID=45954 RepID=A0A9D4S0I1_DREPO|nr:hypothetical protein DPMN_011961 [Dreissena polymorpha]
MVLAPKVLPGSISQVLCRALTSPRLTGQQATDCHFKNHVELGAEIQSRSERKSTLNACRHLLPAGETHSKTEALQDRRDKRSNEVELWSQSIYELREEERLHPLLG